MKRAVVGLIVGLATFFLGTETGNLNQTDAAALPVASAIEIRKPVPEKPAAIENVFEDNYGGWYQFDDFKGMDDVDLIQIYNSVDGEQASAAVFTTYENFGDQGVVGDAWIKIDGNHVKFRTDKINGVRFQFEGTFASASWSDRERQKPLYGTLQKFVKGKKVAEISGDLKYLEPRCWH